VETAKFAPEASDNRELYQVYDEPDIISVVSHRRLSWAGHVVRRDETHPLQQTYRGDFRDGKRARGRPKVSWKDAVDKDSERFGERDWQKLAKDRVKYKNFLDSVKARTRAVDQ
jgi:hypothetical protein